MRSRFFILTLIFILAFGSFAVLLAYFERSNSITLAELSTPQKSGVNSAKNFNEPVGGRAWLASVGLESFFYGVLGVCGIFLALRAIISALYIIKEERSRQMPAPARSNIVQAPEVVIVRNRQWRQNAQTEETYSERPIASGASSIVYTANALGLPNGRCVCAVAGPSGSTSAIDATHAISVAAFRRGVTTSR